MMRVVLLCLVMWHKEITAAVALVFISPILTKHYVGY